MRKRLLLLAVLIGSTICVPAQTGSSQLTVTQVVDSLGRLMEKKKIPGLMLTLMKGDSVLFAGGLGYADKEKALKVNERTLFRMGSVTKSFVALGVMKLVKEGKLTLEDEVKKLAPELTFENPWETEHPVRVKHLLSHTAGFDDMHFREMYNTGEQPEVPLDEVIQMNPGTLRVRWKPGTRYAYSNPGWTIAGYLIEKYSQKPYDEYLNEEVLLPLQMTSSNFESVPAGEQYAKGYKNGDKEVPFLPIYHRPAGAFNSNATDMAKWLRFFIRQGKFDSLRYFAESDIQLMQEPAYSVANRAGLPLGYGLGNYTFDQNLPVQFHGHDGGIDGFISAYGYNTEHGLGYAISNNGSEGMTEMINLIKKFLTQELPPVRLAFVPLDANAIAPFEGFYLVKASRNQLFAFYDRIFSTCTVFAQNDTLFIRPFGGDGFPVFQVENTKGSGLLFAGLNDQTPAHVFTFNDEGLAVMGTSALGNYLEKTSATGSMTRRVLLFGSLGLLLSSFFGAVVWLVFAFRKSISWTDFFKRLVPAIAGLALVAVVVGMFQTLTHLELAGKPNGSSLMVYLGTWVIVFCAFLSARFAIMNFKAGNQLAFSIYYCFLAFSAVTVSLFIYDAGWMGLKIWEY